jgi:hypothetical protein
MQFVVVLEELHDTSVEHQVVKLIQRRPQGDGAVVLRLSRVTLFVNGGDNSTGFSLCFKCELKIEERSHCCVHGGAAIFQELVVDAVEWARGLVVVEAVGLRLDFLTCDVLC